MSGLFDEKLTIKAIHRPNLGFCLVRIDGSHDRHYETYISAEEFASKPDEAIKLALLDAEQRFKKMEGGVEDDFSQL